MRKHPKVQHPKFQHPKVQHQRIQTSEKKNSITIQLIKKTVSYGDGRTEVIKEINFSYTEKMREVSPLEVFSSFLNDFMDESESEWGFVSRESEPIVISDPMNYFRKLFTRVP